MNVFFCGIESGDPVQYGPHRVTPRSLVAWLRIPWPNGGYRIVFNRPVAVEVATGDAPARSLTIINMTRLASIIAAVYGSIAAYAIWRMFNVRK